MAYRCGRADLPAHRAGDPELSRRRAPEQLRGLVDAHAHLQHERFDADREEVIVRAVAAGIERILVPGWDLASSEAALALASRHPGLVCAAVGVHPHHADEMEERDWIDLEELAADPATSAVGEIGLDFHRNLSSPDRQREAFGRQLDLAASRGLPVVVHDRDAHAEVTDRLLAWGGRPRSVRGVLHAFSGDRAMATRLCDAGFVVSFALPLAFRSATGPREAASAVPEGAFLVETDAPYLGPDRDGRNEPTTALRVVAELARLRGTDPDSLVNPIRDAFERLVTPAA